MATSDRLLKQLELARRDLLELTTSNRLLSTPRDKTPGAAIRITDESSAEVFRILVHEGTSLRFEDGSLADKSAGRQSHGDPDAEVETGSTSATATDTSDRKKSSASDDVLHTTLTSEELDRRLQALLDDSATLMQEQGVNVLYLALGFVKWFEIDVPETPRYAPLLLVPVVLEKGRSGKRYSLSWNDGEIETNLTLKVRLKSDFGINLPDVPNAEDLSPITYFQDVNAVIADQRGWEVRADDILLWCFSFTRLLMYRDLDPGNWPTSRPLQDQPLITGLLQDGFPPVESLCSGNENIDRLFDATTTRHVIDCDSSQSLVIEEAARGRNLVIQGPPGTGKSQTITNLIAAAVSSGKTILFVAEKMAALEVVKRRLDNIGLGEVCLELHSRKSNKRIVLREVDRTLKMGAPVLPNDLTDTIRRLKDRQQKLNDYATTLHTPFARSGLTPYQILGELIDLRAAATPLPDFQLSEAAEWDSDEYPRKLASVTDLARVISDIGDPAQHPWRGSTLDHILPLDLERLLTTAPQRIADLDALTDAATALRQKLCDDAVNSLSSIRRLLRTVDALLIAPEIDQQAAANLIWTDHRHAIKELADHARAILEANEKLRGKVTETAWDLDVAEGLRAYTMYGRCVCRMLHAPYRKARQQLKSLLTGPQPGTFEERLYVFELLHRRQVALRKLAEAEADAFAGKVFGRLWLGSQTDLKRIATWEAWDDATVKLGVSPRFRSMLASLDSKEELKRLATDVAGKLDMFLAGYRRLGESLQLNFAVAFGVRLESAYVTDSIVSLEEIALTDIRLRLVEWSKNPEGLQQWQIYRRSNSAAATIGGGVLVERLSSGKMSPQDAPAVFRFARAEALLRAVLKQSANLETFEGVKFETLIEEFCSLDIRRLEIARAEVADEHWKGIGRSRDGHTSEAVQLLKHEMQKQRRHLPLRELLARAGTAVQAVKPVFMMSPLSVAQYLEPGILEFDMLLIDEASQVRPVEALGAAARCRQMVVVGDDKQMPPTQFFGRMLGDTSSDECSLQMQAGDVESILGLAIARNMPQRMLRWHYRSKHESLIAVSNREFYDNQLYVVPSPERSGELGVKWRYVENGRFLKGRNEIEATVVAEAIIRHARECPQWTLGVAAFSVTQRDAILESLAKLRRSHPDLDSFFDPSAADPFFVKNLENVQGDERDAIFVSVGYGPGEDGRVSLNFGPVSATGGERRLNVLMTRAKRVLQIFSSMHAEDIDLTRATGRGPAVFREYLRYAEKGGEFDAARGERSCDRFADIVACQLEERGYSVVKQVGLAGLYVDLAIVDPDNSSRYLMGIVVDGETWSSARSARDRNRTTDGVLQSQGWLIHHLWSLDWFRRPTEQLYRLVETIDSARNGRFTPKEARLASTLSEISRQAGTPDPFSTSLEPENEKKPGSRKRATQEK
jgi:DNA polymerase III delta prime subunit